MPVSVLITQCLQEDFVGLLAPHAPLPNTLHVGHQEAIRLQGLDPDHGPLAQLAAWARQVPPDRLKLVHIQDWHDPQDPRQAAHLQQFGPHCLQETPGAELVPILERGATEADKRIRAIALNDCEDTDLLPVLKALIGSTPLEEVRIGVVGVWTEAKVSLLLYDLKTRLGVPHLATCSALTASASRSRHFMALDNLQQILGIHVSDSVGEFAQWLMPEADAPNLVATVPFGPALSVSGAPLNETEHQVLRYLYRDSAHLQLVPLSGGFSGARVFRVASRDALGHAQASSVAKLGPRSLIAQERHAFEQVEPILGNDAPHVRGFVDLGEWAGIQYAFAGMGQGEVRTFQSLYPSSPPEALTALLKTVFQEVLGRFYAAAQYEPLPLLQHYGFSPRWAANVRARVAAILGDDLSQAAPLLDFYDHFLTPDRLQRPEHHYVAYVHGDLNGANILVDQRHNVWIIDFFHTARGHVLKDLAKFENDLLYLMTPLDNERAYQEARLLIRALGDIRDLRAPLPPSLDGVQTPILRQTWQIVGLLRQHVARLVREDRDPWQLWIAHLRYAAHTLSFDEANPWQKRLALDAAVQWATRIQTYARANALLRVDWIPVAKPGRLGLTLLPGRADRGRDLAFDLDRLQALGTDVLISLLPDPELAWAGVSQLPQEAAARGLEVWQLPIKDQSVPDLEEARQLIVRLQEPLDAGRSVVMHCRAGLGRAGTLAACFLVSQGIPPQQAIAQVRASRDPRAVETPGQEAFVHAFATHLEVP